MVYGLISEKDDERTRLKFQGKQIDMKNVMATSQIVDLLKVLQKGDIVYVMHVNRFMSVNAFKVFGKICMEKGVQFYVDEQPFLNITNRKGWSYQIMWHLERMNELECLVKKCLVKNFRMRNESWEVIYRCLEMMNLEILAQTFSADGILKK